MAKSKWYLKRQLTNKPLNSRKAETGKTMSAKVELSKDGKKLMIELDFDVNGTPSVTGKSRVHATTHGNQQFAINGKVLNVGVNAYSK